MSIRVVHIDHALQSDMRQSTTGRSRVSLLQGLLAAVPRPVIALTAKLYVAAFCKFVAMYVVVEIGCDVVPLPGKFASSTVEYCEIAGKICSISKSSPLE